MSKVNLMALSLIFSIGSFGSAMAETVREHGAHEHGVSKLKIAIEKNQMQLILESPGADVIGFEHKPENSEEKAAVAKALALLNAPDKLFIMPPQAACSTLSVKVEYSQDEEHEHGHEEGHEEAHADGHEEGHEEAHEDGHEEKHEEAHEDGHEEKHEEAHMDGHEGEHEETHSEFHASYLFDCASPEKLAVIGLKFFELFPNSEEMELQAVSDYGQLSAEISNDKREINLSTIMK